MSWRKILLSGFNNLEEVTSQILLAGIVILVGMQVFLRDFFNFTLDWNEELSRFIFVWFVYLGMSYATKKGNHIRVLFQFLIFKEATRKKILAITDIVWIAFDIIMVYKSVEVILFMFRSPYISPTLNVPVAYVYFIFPLAFSLNAFRTIQYNYAQLRSTQPIGQNENHNEENSS